MAGGPYFLMQFNIPAEFKNASGVYIIRNTVNDKVYVGSSVNFMRRFYEHRKSLQDGTHHSRNLQAFAIKYGCEKLSFELLDVTTANREAIVSCEQKWLDTLRPYLREVGFNTLSTADSCLGHKWSEERKAKARLARKPLTEAQLSALSSKGHTRSKETRAKIAASKQGKKLILNDEQRQKIAQRLRGGLTPEAEQRRRDNHRAYYAALRAANSQKYKSTSPKRCISEETKQKLNSPESIAKRTATQRAQRLARLQIC